MATSDPSDALRLLRQADEDDLEIHAERRRYGKFVTVVEGALDGHRANDLARRLKKTLAVGGTAQAGRIELQGDQRARALVWLRQAGFDAVIRAES